MIEIGITELVIIIAAIIIIIALIKAVFVLIPPAITAVIVWFVMEDYTYAIVAFVVILVLSILFKK
ncbi:hypothetical protein [Candidatus Methanomassiliicoccus intestinalis]|uniref:hypothetical protein n=1 Tax=Candidatus Methanomassiliicoccus intestinalis TaxID=1406512 RepID=UPI0037DBF4C4